MAIKRIRVDYTVYVPNHHPGEPCWDFRAIQRTKGAARGLGVGSTIYRNFNQTNKRGRPLGDWWSGRSYWIWDGVKFRKKPDPNLLPRS